MQSDGLVRLRGPPIAESDTLVPIDDFIARWQHSEGSERANKDSFCKDLCRALGVPEPNAKTGDPEQDVYVFEADAVIHEHDGQKSGLMDLYKQGCFVLEAKQGSNKGSKKKGTAVRGTPGWSSAMNAAQGQALRYTKGVAQPPPFVIVTDIGYCFDLFACFDGSGAYHAYPNNQKNRIFLSDLANHSDCLRAIWLDPRSLDPARKSEEVTREIATDLAVLAGELEKTSYSSEVVARFLMRCVFTMFAEDIGLLREKVFTTALEKTWIPDPSSFKTGVEALWDAMNSGKSFFILGKLLQFNGGLFADPEALPLEATQLRILLKAAKREWCDVQPAIFGTLIERALDPKERHKLGAHFTPTSYVERLLVPTIEEPLRAEWDIVRVRVRQLVPPGEFSPPKRVNEAQSVVREFLEKLCNTTVLDPACGSANFLYVALNLFKRLESEVLATLFDLGMKQQELGENMMVTPRQFKGIEARRGSKEIAELVLWIGYLQWHHKMYGQSKTPPEPILRDDKNIECRDAVLAYDHEEEARNEHTGALLTFWDGETMKKSHVTGDEVPDETAQVPVVRYINPRRADWPAADFIVGNPPFVGNGRMRGTLGEGYAETIRDAYPELPESCDYVMYWWHKAAELVRAGRARRFGFIATNSLRQTFNRRVVRTHLSDKEPLSLVFAIPDHPWVDSADGAAVRISMTVGQAGIHAGRLLSVQCESNQGSLGATIELATRIGTISADLSVGADVSSAAPLRSNEALSCPGVKLHGSGFVVRPDKAEQLGLGRKEGLERHIREYRNGRDVTQTPRGVWVIDLFGLTLGQVQKRFPEVFQHIHDTVKPERDQNRRAVYRDNWWIHGEPRSAFRPALVGLSRFIATVETAKHRVFVFLDEAVLPDNMLVNIAADDAYVLGVLSSRIHVAWALAAGGTLEDRPRYNKTRCFETFPFPSATETQRQCIRDLGEQLDGHRRRQQAAHPQLTITAMYNVLEKLRSGEPLTDKERLSYDQGLVSGLQRLHSDLDEAVCSAYGWSGGLSDDIVLEKLLTLNQVRTAEESSGTVRWLRPAFQEAKGAVPRAVRVPEAPEHQLQLPWPMELPQQVAAIRDFIVASSEALTANDVAALYIGASADAVVPALETLEALGMAVSFNGKHRQWKAVARTTGERSIGPNIVKVSTRPPPRRETA
jgi:hypothetical protein